MRPRVRRAGSDGRDCGSIRSCGRSARSAHRRRPCTEPSSWSAGGAGSPHTEASRLPSAGRDRWHGNRIPFGCRASNDGPRPGRPSRNCRANATGPRPALRSEEPGKRRDRTGRRPRKRSSRQAGRPDPRRSAGHPAWPRTRQCTNIQTGPVDGGRSCQRKSETCRALRQGRRSPDPCLREGLAVASNRW